MNAQAAALDLYSKKQTINKASLTNIISAYHLLNSNYSFFAWQKNKLIGGN
ncbi:MAG: hypothetical protein ACI9FO_001130 [Methylophagaceae bacterium]|jgi:hypothetical protein